MTNDEMIHEALRLSDEGNYADALKLWESLSSLTSLDVVSQCVFLLNERKCRSALGQHEIALQLLDKVENIDAAHEFRLQTEFARIDDLYKQNKFAEANKRSQQFAKENAAKLVSPEFAIIAYEQKLGLACGLVSASEFTAGLHLLTEMLPAAENPDKPQIHYYRALAYLRLKQEDAAIEELKQILVLNNHDQWAASAHYDLGRTYDNRGAFAWAKQHLQKAELLKEVISIPVREVYMSLSNVCFKLHELEESKRYRKLAEREPKSDQIM
jgi:tetratricopeptide (TPR) repeat protein